MDELGAPSQLLNGLDTTTKLFGIDYCMVLYGRNNKGPEAFTTSEVKFKKMTMDQCKGGDHIESPGINFVCKKNLG